MRDFAVLWRKRHERPDSRAATFGAWPKFRTVTTLKGKRDEITRAIVNYENKIAQAKVDLAHINATIRIFEIGEDGPVAGSQTVAPYVDIYRMFKRGEMVAICKAALARGR